MTDYFCAPCSIEGKIFISKDDLLAELNAPSLEDVSPTLLRDAFALLAERRLLALIPNDTTMKVNEALIDISSFR